MFNPYTVALQWKCWEMAWFYRYCLYMYTNALHGLYNWMCLVSQLE